MQIAEFPVWFFILIVAVSLFVILWRRPRRLPLAVPSYVRIVDPLPDEEGRCLLIRSGHDTDEYRVALRDGSVRSYGRAELEEWIAP